jgi:hypothetical protein
MDNKLSWKRPGVEGGNLDRDELEPAGFDAAKWTPCQVVGQNGMQPWGAVDATPAEQRELPPATCGGVPGTQNRPERHGFRLRLGYYEVYLNGAKVGDHVLDPS